MSRKFDFSSLKNQQNQKRKDLSSYGVYKRVAKKVRPVDSSKMDGSIPGETATWKKDAMAKEVYVLDSLDKYAK